MSDDHKGSWLKQRIRIAQLEFDLHRAGERAYKLECIIGQLRDKLESAGDKEFALRRQLGELHTQNTAMKSIINHPDFISIRDKVLEERGVSIPQEPTNG